MRDALKQLPGVVNTLESLFHVYMENIVLVIVGTQHGQPSAILCLGYLHYENALIATALHIDLYIHLYYYE